MYISDDYELSDKIKVNAGLRFSYFQALEKDSSNIDLDSNIVGLVSAKEYFGLEPRLSVRYRLNSNSSIKAAYTENYQYIHLASTSAVSLPTDLWVPSSSKIEPKFSRQYALGYFKNFVNDTYEASLEGYYKEMDNLIEYKEVSYQKIIQTSLVTMLLHLVMVNHME